MVGIVAKDIKGNVQRYVMNTINYRQSQRLGLNSDVKGPTFGLYAPLLLEIAAGISITADTVPLS